MRTHRPVVRRAQSPLRLWIFLAAATLTATSAAAAAAAAAHDVVTFDVGAHARPNATAGLRYRVRGWAPVGGAPAASPSSPLLLFSTAFAASIPGERYDDLMRGVAGEHGVVVLSCDHRLGAKTPKYRELATMLEEVVAWALSGPDDGLRGALARAGANSTRADPREKLVIAGHSAGAHIATQMLVRNCTIARTGARALGAVLIDPVDGVDPFGIVDDRVLPPSGRLNVSVPALHIETGLDAKARIKGLPPCAPPNMSNQIFYDAWAGPIWQVNATEFGHLDCGDFGRGMGLVCPGSKLDRSVFQRELVRLIGAFLRGLFAEDDAERSSAYDVLEDGASMAVENELRHTYAGVPRAEIGAACSLV